MLHYQEAILGVEKNLLVPLKSDRECRLVREILQCQASSGKWGSHTVDDVDFESTDCGRFGGFVEGCDESWRH
jgi:hypothetical protein